MLTKDSFHFPYFFLMLPNMKNYLYRRFPTETVCLFRLDPCKPDLSKVSNFKLQIGNLNFNQTTGG